MNNNNWRSSDYSFFKEDDWRQSSYELNDDAEEYLLELNGSNNLYPWLLNKNNDPFPSTVDFKVDFSYTKVPGVDGSYGTVTEQTGKYKGFSVYDHNIGGKQQNFFHISYDDIKLQYQETVNTNDTNNQEENIESITWAPQELNITFTILHCNNAKKNILNFFRNNITEAIGLNLANNKPSFLKRKIKTDFSIKKDKQHDLIKQQRNLPSGHKDVTAHEPVRISDYEYLDVHPIDYSYKETDEGAIEISVNFFVPKPAFYKKWALMATDESGVQKFNLPESPIDIEWLAKVGFNDHFDLSLNADHSVNLGSLKIMHKDHFTSSELAGAEGMPHNLSSSFKMKSSSYLGKVITGLVSYNGDNKIQLNNIKTGFKSTTSDLKTNELIHEIADNFHNIAKNLPYAVGGPRTLPSLNYDPYDPYHTNWIYRDDFHIDAYLRDINFSILQENADEYGFRRDEISGLLENKDRHNLSLVVYLKQYNYL